MEWLPQSAYRWWVAMACLDLLRFERIQGPPAFCISRPQKPRSRLAVWPRPTQFGWPAHWRFFLFSVHCRVSFVQLHVCSATQLRFLLSVRVKAKAQTGQKFGCMLAAGMPGLSAFVCADPSRWGLLRCIFQFPISSTLKTYGPRSELRNSLFQRALIHQGEPSERKQILSSGNPVFFSHAN